MLFLFIVGKDFINTSKVVHFKLGETKSAVKIPLADDDIFPEENKTFEVYLTASQGVFIYPNGYAQAVIFNDDRPLPGRNVCMCIICMFFFYVGYITM